MHLAKKDDMGGEQVVKLLQLADEDNALGLSSLEKRRKWCMHEMHQLDMHIIRSKNHLHSVNDEVASSKQLLNSYHISCERKRQKAENLNNQISRLEALVCRFKNNSEEYIKIKKTVEEEASKFLTHSKVLIQFALASVIEALRRNPDKYNNLLLKNKESSTPGQDSLPSHIEGYKDAILEVADKLYDMLLKHFTNSMDNAVADSSFNPTLSLPSSSSFLGSYNQSNTYRKEEPEIL